MLLRFVGVAAVVWLLIDAYFVVREPATWADRSPPPSGPSGPSGRGAARAVPGAGERGGRGGGVAAAAHAGGVGGRRSEPDRAGLRLPAGAAGHNTGGRALAPHFTLATGQDMNPYWSVAEGPATLAAHTTAHYELRPPAGRFGAARAGVRIRLRAFTASPQTLSSVDVRAVPEPPEGRCVRPGCG